MDATYAIKLIVPHHGASAVLEFNGLHLQRLDDENWGIANLTVRPLSASQVRKPAVDSIGVAFRTLLDTQADEYVQAFQTLISGMDDTANWIDQNVKPAPLDVARVEELVQKVLNDRQNAAVAAADLRRMGQLVEPFLRDARKVAGKDARGEIDSALETLGVTAISDDSVRRVIVATRVLEVIGTPRALAVRKKLTSDRGNP